ncbi:iron transporter [Halomarina halobia]|uniref:Iron transporter n=1 Tax=Halomarina halobia TaxID=3033386 RepID=A0ABD6A9Q8_9EURY|nr:iron transporter [Halomarina sp. PSR21]
MDRRAFLRATGGLAGAAALAGCVGSGLLDSSRVPPVLDDRPDAVYLPTHREGMGMLGTGKTDDLAVLLGYSYPHRFWNVNGTEVERTPVSGDVHLMATVWDRETAVVVPGADLSFEIVRDGEAVAGPEVLYPMLSQSMGVHYGDNVALAGDGEYAATVRIGALDTRRTGAFRDRFDEQATVSIDFEYERAARDDLRLVRYGNEAGERRAMRPTSMDALAPSTAPERADLPGSPGGRAEAGDAIYVVTALDAPPAGLAGDGGGRYLAVSARTRYNRFVLPAMGLRGTLSRGDETVFEGDLVRTLDPKLNYHYGTVVPDVQQGDSLALSATVPPQVARHEGYETAFFDPPDAEVVL